MMQVTHASSRRLEGRTVHNGALWFSVLCGPLAALTNEAVEYVIVSWSCGRFDSASRILVHVVPAALIILCIIAGLTAWSARSRVDLASDAVPADADQSNRSFLALVAVGLNVLGILVILAQWLPVLYLDPCLT